MTDKAFDTIQHLEWLRNVLKSTHRNGFTGTIFDYIKNIIEIRNLIEDALMNAKLKKSVAEKV